jgi:hypothetical protein
LTSHRDTALGIPCFVFVGSPRALHAYTIRCLRRGGNRIIPRGTVRNRLARKLTRRILIVLGSIARLTHARRRRRRGCRLVVASRTHERCIQARSLASLSLELPGGARHTWCQRVQIRINSACSTNDALSVRGRGWRCCLIVASQARTLHTSALSIRCRSWRHTLVLAGKSADCVSHTDSIGSSSWRYSLIL